MVHCDDDHVPASGQGTPVVPGQGPRSGAEATTVDPEEHGLGTGGVRGPHIENEAVLALRELGRLIQSRRGRRRLRGGRPVVLGVEDTGPGRDRLRRSEAVPAAGRGRVGDSLERQDWAGMAALDAAGGQLDDRPGHLVPRVRRTQLPRA